MNDLWYKKLGFYNNPFSIKPGLYDNELVAYDMPFIYKKIDKGEMVFLEGEYGTGKTTILKNIISQFRGKNKIIYYSFNTENGFNLQKLLDGANTTLRKMMGLRTKDVILLLDEVHTMKSADAKKLIKPFKDGILKSVVFVSHDYSLTNFPEDYDSFLSGNIIRTVDLSSKEAVALVRRRIGNIDLLTDNIISKIFLISGKNPRRLLEYCEDVCRYALEIGDTKVTDYHLDEVLGKVVKERQRKAKSTQKKSFGQEKPKEEKIEVPVPVPVPAPKLNVKSADVKKEKKEKVVPLSAAKEQIQDDEEDSPYIEIKELPQKDSREKKFKINKLVGDEKKNTLGTIMETEEQEEEQKKKEEPEYKIYFVDE